MKIKTSELTGLALDWAVAVCEGKKPYIIVTADEGINIGCGFDKCISYQEWVNAGPIIEREGLSVEPFKGRAGSWACFDFKIGNVYRGPTLLVAAMRCYVASKIGDEVEIPKEITK